MSAINIHPNPAVVIGPSDCRFHTKQKKFSNCRFVLLKSKIKKKMFSLVSSAMPFAIYK
jgi:hypothetical protein